MSLSFEEREAVVRIRIEKSLRTLAEAKANVHMQLWPAAANRLYYAAYYAVSALVIANGDTAQTHAGVKVVFNLHFVKEGKVSREIATTYNELFLKRMTGDYDDTYDLQAADVLPLVEPAEDLINTINQLTEQLLSGK